MYVDNRLTMPKYPRRINITEKHIPCVPLAIKTIMIALFKILTLFHFKAIRSSWLTFNEILIVSIAKGTQ